MLFLLFLIQWFKSLHCDIIAGESPLLTTTSSDAQYKHLTAGGSKALFFSLALSYPVLCYVNEVANAAFTWNQVDDRGHLVNGTGENKQSDGNIHDDVLLR